MGEQSFYFDVFTGKYFLKKGKSFFIRGNADTPHTGICFDMYLDHPAGLSCRLLKKGQTVLPKHAGTNLFQRQSLIAIGEGISQDQNRLPDPFLSKQHCFLGSGHGKSPHKIQFLGCLGNGDASVSVSIRLDHSDHSCLFIDHSLHIAQVAHNGIQIDLCVAPTAIFRYLLYFLHDKLSLSLP